MKTFSIVLIIIIVSSCSVVLLLKWPSISKTFWEFKFFDIADILVTLVIAGFITYLVSEKLNNTVRKREFLLNLLQELHNQLNCIYVDGTEYMERKTTIQGRAILAGFKKVNIILDFLHKISVDKRVKCERVFDNSLRGDVLNLKILLTDRCFLVKKSSYTVSDKDKFTQLYTRINHKLCYCKINLFS